jgi:hypothetical protein
MSDAAKFESLRMKARKLAALAARGVGGERNVAAAKLTAFLALHGMTLDSLEASERRTRELVCVLDPKKPRADEDLARLAFQCCVYVLGYCPEGASYRRKEVMKNAKGKARTVAFYVHHVDMTEPEFEDWQACFGHYAQAFEATRVRLRRMLKAALKGFIQAHELFSPPDDSQESKPLTAAELQAVLDAMRNSQGDKWERPAGRLQQEGFLLQ